MVLPYCMLAHSCKTSVIRDLRRNALGKDRHSSAASALVSNFVPALVEGFISDPASMRSIITLFSRRIGYLPRHMGTYFLIVDLHANRFDRPKVESSINYLNKMPNLHLRYYLIPLNLRPLSSPPFNLGLWLMSTNHPGKLSP